VEHEFLWDFKRATDDFSYIFQNEEIFGGHLMKYRVCIKRSRFRKTNKILVFSLVIAKCQLSPLAFQKSQYTNRTNWCIEE
jgi:hypothetical protein